MEKVNEPEFLCHQMNSILNKVISSCDIVVAQDIEKKLLDLKVDIIALRSWGMHYMKKCVELEPRDELLTQLEEYGVDSWSGYADAMMDI